MVVKIYNWVLLNTYKDVKRSKIEDVLEKAFKAWERYIDLKFIKSEIPFGENTTIFVKFHSSELEPSCNSLFDGKRGILAHATQFNKSLGNLLIHFDSNEDWSFCDPENNNDKNFYNFYTVAVHEIGHILGLKHTKDETSIMNYRYKKDVTSTNFKDILNAQEIHGVNKNIGTFEKCVIFFKANLYEIIIYVLIASFVYFKLRTKKRLLL